MTSLPRWPIATQNPRRHGDGRSTRLVPSRNARVVPGQSDPTTSKPFPPSTTRRSTTFSLLDEPEMVSVMLAGLGDHRKRFEISFRDYSAISSFWVQIPEIGYQKVVAGLPFCLVPDVSSHPVGNEVGFSGSEGIITKGI